MLSKIERGESVPTITTVWKIANGLKITLNALAGDGENNYTVKDIATMTPLIDEGGLFSLYNVFPFSPLDGVQVFYGVFKPGYHYHAPHVYPRKCKEGVLHCIPGGTGRGDR